MNNTAKKKKLQLGNHIGTATSKLKKIILFDLVKQLDKNICYQCGKKIENINEFSIEHKIPWLDSSNPKKLFFDLNNIAFSHLSCNIKAARQTKILKHPSQESYRRGCRCSECKEIQKIRLRKYRKIKRES